MNMFSTMIQQHLPKVNSFVLSSVFFLFIIQPSYCTSALSPEIHESILSVIEQVFSDNHKEAEDQAKKLIRHFPDHPAGYFCMAFLLDNWMVKYETDKKEDEFYRYCDQAIEKGERILSSNRKDEWARFFIAGADGFKGTYEARYERWITAFRLGWKGVSVLLELEAEGCEIPDIRYGIASYNYWRSALTKMLWWMPGIEDKRDEAIKELYAACENALFTGNLAVASLIDVLINEKRFGDALVLIDSQMGKYPDYSQYQWARVRALTGLRRCDEAIVACHRFLEKYAGFNPNNHYLEIMCRAELIRCYIVKKEYAHVLTECDSVKKVSLERSIKKRLEPVLNEIKASQKLAMKGLGNKR